MITSPSGVTRTIRERTDAPADTTIVSKGSGEHNWRATQDGVVIYKDRHFDGSGDAYYRGDSNFDSLWESLNEQFDELERYNAHSPYILRLINKIRTALMGNGTRFEDAWIY